MVWSTGKHFKLLGEEGNNIVIYLRGGKQTRRKNWAGQRIFSLGLNHEPLPDSLVTFQKLKIGWVKQRVQFGLLPKCKAESYVQEVERTQQAYPKKGEKPHAFHRLFEGFHIWVSRLWPHNPANQKVRMCKEWAGIMCHAHTCDLSRCFSRQL